MVTLTTIERAADAWSAARLSHFDPFVWASREERYLRRKAFAELAIYCLVRLHFDDAMQTAERERLCGFVVERVNEPGFADLVMRGPRQFLLYSAAVLCAHRLNAVPPPLAAAVEAVLDGRTVWSCERPPHRMLDLWHFLNGYGHAGAARLDRDAIVAASCLQSAPDPIDCTLSEAYALTHNLLFLHNFGCGGENYLAQPGGFAIADVVEAQIIRWLGEPNFDIALELAMTGMLEQKLNPRLAAYVIRRLDDAVARDGFISGPRPPKSEALPAPAIEPEGAGSFTDWALHYHTNLVAASAMRVLRARGAAAIAAAAPLDDEAMLALSAVFTDLASYELTPAAAAIAGIGSGDDDIVRWTGLARAYLTRQKRASGLYGYYLDEAKLHSGALRSGADSLAQFEADLQRPLSAHIDALMREDRHAWP